MRAVLFAALAVHVAAAVRLTLDATLGATLSADGAWRARLTTAYTAFVVAGFAAVLVGIAAGALAVRDR